MSMKTTDGRSDSDLLLAYGRDGDEAAFETLARRHVDMIFAVSLRRADSRQIAEEATQNVLLGLSRNARKLSAHERNLAGWLHKSTSFEVSKLKRREARIKTRERAYADHEMSATTPADDEAFHRLYPILDQAIDSLRAPDREVIVRRYLEGQNFRRIADSLGISEDAAQKRTSRAFDRLNFFFRKRAGITVSAVALTAGISRHCADAAPATCLNILGATAATGAASGISAAHITAAGKMAAVATGVVVLGGTIALVAIRNEPRAEAVSSRATETVPPRLPSAGEDPTPLPGPSGPPAPEDAGSTAGEAKDYSPNAELARLEAMNPHPGEDEFTRRLAVKHEQLLTDLTDDLALSAAQVASTKDLLDSRLDTFRSALETGPLPGTAGRESMRKEEDTIAAAGEIIRGAGLRDDLMDILSSEQLAAFDEREAEAWRAQVESHAYAEFSKLAPALDFTEEQKDRVFELLQASSDEMLRAGAAQRAYIAMRKNQAAPSMDLPDPAEMEFIIEAIEGPNPLAPDSPEFKKRAIEVIGGRIEQRVGLLAPVLDERQRQRYRDHLEQRSMLSGFGIELPAHEEP